MAYTITDLQLHFLKTISEQS